MKTEKITVTPLQAANWLDSGNYENRAVRKAWVKELAGMIRRGEFKLTHQGIAFDCFGRLIDGQHRLMAIVEAGVSVQTLVTFNAEASIFNALDCGARRSFADMYGIGKDVASISRLIGTLYFGAVSVEQQASIHSIIEQPATDLLKFCSYKKKNFTGAPIRTAAVCRFIAGEDFDYIKLMYWNVAHVQVSDLPPIGRSFVDQLYAKTEKTRGMDRFDLFARALKVFDEKQRMTQRLQINDTSTAYEFVKNVFGPLLDPEKKPTSSASAATRAKSAQLSQVRTA